jgi:WD40 repeat protein
MTRLRAFWLLPLLFASTAGMAEDQPSAKPDADARPHLIAQLGHTEPILSVSFSRDGQRVLTGGLDHLACLWDAPSGLELRTFEGHSGGVTSAVFSPDGTWVLTGSDDKTARLWDAQTGKELRTFEGHTGQVFSVEFSPDGKQVLTGSEDRTAKLWDARTGKELRSFTGHTGAIRSVAFMPDGKQVLTGSHDKTARLWDTQTGKLLQTFQGHTAPINAVAIAPDGKQILTGSGGPRFKDDTARLWDVKTGQEIRTFQGHTEPVKAVAFSLDGKQVVTGSEDKTARLWDAQTGQVQQTFAGPIVLAVALSPDGQQVLTGGPNRGARLWDARTGKELRAFQGQANRIKSVAFSSDGQHVLTGSHGEFAHLWDLRAGKEVRRFAAHSDIGAVAFSPDGQRVLVGSADKKARLWDAQNGQELQAFQGHTLPIVAVAFSADGAQILTGSDDKTARLWDVQSGKELHTLEGHTGPVWAVAFAPDGQRVATGGEDGTVRIWDARTGMELQSSPGQKVRIHAVAFSPDGKKVLSGGSDKTARLLETRTGKELRTFEGHAGPVLTVAFTPDGKGVLTGSADGTARLWDAASGQSLRTFQGHTGHVTSLALGADAKWLLTGSTDKTSRLWDFKSGQALTSLVSFRNSSWAVTDPDGRFDASNGGDIEGLHWVVGNEPIALKQLKERYYDPGLLAKTLGFNKEPLRAVSLFTGAKLFPDVTVTKAPTGNGKCTLELTNRGGGLGKVQVFVNGKELLADARGPKVNPTAPKATLNLDLSGAPVLRGQPNHVQIVAWNSDGFLSSRGLELDWVPEGTAPTDPPELYAIVAGISTYSNPSLNLRFAAKDAEDMAKALELAAKGLFGADKVHLTLLTTSATQKSLTPSKDNFRKAFDAVRKARPTDVLVVYLAGHGAALQKGQDVYCYLTQEARSTDPAAFADPEVLKQCAITSEELVEWIKQVPALKQVMLLDTCAAGAAAAKLMDHRELSGDQIRAIDRLKDRTGFQVLMGCAADRVSYEATQYSQGLLTYALLQGMRGAALREGEYVDVSQLFQYAADEVPRLARNIGGIQKPLILAPRGTSFDVGRLTKDDRAAIPLAQVKPLILRPLLVNSDVGDDDLGLIPEVRRCLADASTNVSRGPANPPVAVYVDADEMPGAIRPGGTYTVEGKRVKVRLVLRKDGETVARADMEGTKDDLPGLAGKIVAAINQNLKKP